MHIAYSRRAFASYFGGIRKKRGGNADHFENTRVAGKAIRKTMKTKEKQIDGPRAATRKCMKTKARSRGLVERDLYVLENTGRAKKGIAARVRSQRSLFEITQGTILQIWTLVNSKLVSRSG